MSLRGDLAARLALGVWLACVTSLGCSTSDRSNGPSCDTHVLPTRPTTSPVAGETRWFVVRKFLLGTELASGQQTVNAWKDIGLDRDGRSTSADDSKNGTNTCQRVSGTATTTLLDGNCGIDNAFGAHLMQTIRLWEPSLEDETSLGASIGEENFLLRVDGVVDGDNARAPGALYLTATHYDPHPAFDGTDVFSVVSDSLVDGASLDQPIVRFPDGYITAGTWVSGLATSTFVIPLRVYFHVRGSWRLPIENGIVAFSLSDGTGTVSGVGSPALMKAAVTEVLSEFGMCPDDYFPNGFREIIDQSLDLVLDAPQFQDPSVTCNAFSLGLGIVMAPAAAPTDVAPPIVEPPNLCAGDAGVDGG